MSELRCAVVSQYVFFLAQSYNATNIYVNNIHHAINSLNLWFPRVPCVSTHIRMSLAVPEFQRAVYMRPNVHSHLTVPCIYIHLSPATPQTLPVPYTYVSRP